MLIICFKAQFFFLVSTFLLVSYTPYSCSLQVQVESLYPISQKFQILGQHQHGEGSRRTERLMLADFPEVNSTFILAPKRTYRKDPLDDFKRYKGGWNITNTHYWASVAYTAAPFFIIAIVWFLIFGICLMTICICYYCCLRRREPCGYSQIAYALSLIFLVLATISSIIGCLVLYMGQRKFHSSTINTLEYVVRQADITSENLRNVSEYLSAAKQYNVDQVFLPPNVQTDIDQIQALVDTSATALSSRTEDNSENIRNQMKSMHLVLIVLAIAILLLTLLGSVFSFFGMQLLVYILVIVGWILVTGTFILCGIFLLLHNVTGDTCVAMNHWVQNPTAHTALDDILPCVDTATAQETSTRSKEVTSELVNLINTVITNISNINFAPNFARYYYNQSGPLLPILCNPFNPDLTERICTPGEVDLSNATQVWSGFVCQTSPDGICVTTGRLNPTFYGQMSAGLNVSYGLSGYSPFLVDLQDCTFARQTFLDITMVYCPGLRRYSEWIYVGLVMAAIAVMLSMVFLVIYVRERRHRLNNKHRPREGEGFRGDHKHT